MSYAIVGFGKMIHSRAWDLVQSLIGGSDPETVFMVQIQGLNVQCTAIETGSGKRLPDAVHQSL